MSVHHILLKIFGFEGLFWIDFDPLFGWVCEFRFNPCRDPELVKRIGAATALEVRATGIQYAFAPCIAVYIQ